MDKFVNDPTDGYFYSAVLNVLIRTEGFKSLIEPFHASCNCPAYKLAVQGFNDKISLAEFLFSISPAKPDLRWFVKKLLEINHDCVSHRSLQCDSFCIFHSNFIFKSTSIFNCQSGHSHSSITSDCQHPIFKISLKAYFPKVPSILQHTTSPSSSLICPYSRKLISLYSQTPISKCMPPCRSRGLQTIIPENYATTLIFLVKYPKTWSEIENLRFFASFPKLFNSNELFESEASRNYSISGFLLEKKGKFSSISLNLKTKKWIFFENGENTAESYFECVLRSVLNNFSIVSVFYSISSGSVLETNDHMWLYMENKIINRYTLNGQIEGIRESAYMNRYWTCIKCKNINFDGEVCKCNERFSVDQLGWICNCLKRNASESCKCGVVVKKCFVCMKNHTKINVGRAFGSCLECKEWKCTVCCRVNSSMNTICLFCFNPNLGLALTLKQLPEVL